MAASLSRLNLCARASFDVANQEKPSLLLITGPTGVGKSVVADEVFEILRRASIPIALINFDELTYASPLSNDPYGTKLGLKNLRAVWPNYVEAGINSLIIPYVVESQQDIDNFRGSIPNADVLVVRLTASITTLEERLRSRPMGGSLEWHLIRAQELTDHYAGNNIGDIVIDTNNRTIYQVAEEVITKWGDKA
jgi:adenylylsulfate kinase-like enzyme